MKNLKSLSVWIATLSIIAFFILYYIVGFTSIFNSLDHNVFMFFRAIAIKHSTVLPKFITDLGDAHFLLIFLVISSIVLVFYKYSKLALLLGVTTISGILSNVLFKEIFKKLRPAVEYHLIDAQGYGFPSGHALYSICFYGSLIYIVFRLVKFKTLKYFLSGILLLLIILISLSRIYLGVHYPTDVLGGWFLGLFIIFLWINIYNLKMKNTS